MYLRDKILDATGEKQNFVCYLRHAKFWLLLRRTKILRVSSSIQNFAVLQQNSKFCFLDTAQENQNFGNCFREPNLICADSLLFAYALYSREAKYSKMVYQSLNRYKFYALNMLQYKNRLSVASIHKWDVRGISVTIFNPNQFLVRGPKVHLQNGLSAQLKMQGQISLQILRRQMIS